MRQSEWNIHVNLFPFDKKPGFLSDVSFDCPGSSFMTSLGQHLLHHCLSHKRQNDPKRQALKEKHLTNLEVDTWFG